MPCVTTFLVGEKGEYACALRIWSGSSSVALYAAESMDAKSNSTPGLSDLRDAFRLLDRDQNGTLDLQEPVMARLGS